MQKASPTPDNEFSAQQLLRLFAWCAFAHVVNKIRRPVMARCDSRCDC